MKRISSCTATTLRSINFGAVLQSYALNRSFIQLGVENYVIDYMPVKSIYSMPKSLFSRSGMITLLLNFWCFVNRRDVMLCHERFDEFIQKNIITTKPYYSFGELVKSPPIVDFYINGSDQVFGLRGESDSERMLQFGNETKKRFSYAASLGEYDWNEEEKREFAKKIEKFSMISVREQYAKDYIEKFSKSSCEIHIDPVFLLEKKEWDSVAAERLIDGEYILCYPLVGNSDTQNVLDELKKKTGFQTVCVQTNPLKRVKADKYIFNAGPAEFLSLFKNAKFIVTSSFHGTAFSLIFEKPFYTLIKDYKSQRITELLNMVNLGDRIYSIDKSVNNDDIDFSKCKNIIEKERKRGFDYLERVIDDVKKTRQ